MSVETTYTDMRQHLAEYMDRAVQDREVIIIHRTRRTAGQQAPSPTPDVAMIAAVELSSLMETAHLMRSPANAMRLLTALQRALEDIVAPSSIATLEQMLTEGDVAPAAGK